MRVLCLSVEKGMVLGVNFTPIVHNGCWVGEAEVTDPAVLARMATMEQFSLEHPGLVPVVTPAVPEPAPGRVVVVVPVPEVVTIGGLPQDLPGRAHLERAGIDQVEDILAMSDDQLRAVEGIGPKTLKEIRERLKG